MYWDPLKEFHHAHDHQDHHRFSETSQLKPGIDGKIPKIFSGKAHEEMGRLLKVVTRKRLTKEKVGSDICKADGVVSRVCADCSTFKTPLWRGGPAGPKSLCNACGIRYRKRRKRGLDYVELESNVWMKEKKSQEILFLLQRKLEEEAEAAVLLMALSCGLFVQT